MCVKTKKAELYILARLTNFSSGGLHCYSSVGSVSKPSVSITPIKESLQRRTNEYFIYHVPLLLLEAKPEQRRLH